MFWCHRKLLKHLVEGEQQPIRQQVNSIFFIPVCWLVKASEIVITTYLLSPWCRVLLEKLTGLQLVKNSNNNS